MTRRVPQFLPRISWWAKIARDSFASGFGAATPTPVIDLMTAGNNYAASRAWIDRRSTAIRSVTRGDCRGATKRSRGFCAAVTMQSLARESFE
jgi:hypothetical protein